jgi:pepF/M3 family oligoendopeptidase
MHKSDTLPHWDMNPIYPGLDTPAFKADFEATLQAIEELKTQFDTHAVMLREEPLTVDEETVTILEAILETFNRVRAEMHTLYAYVVCHIATDSRNETAQARMSEMQQAFVRFAKLQTRLTAWIGSLEDVDTLIEASAMAREHAYALHKAAVQAEHLMPPAEEALAADLHLTGGAAWAKLYNNVTSQITVTLEQSGEAQTLPITAVRNLAFDPDRDVRQAAYEAELDAWEAHAVPIAAALNSIKGQMLTLSEKRGWDSPLDVALFNNNIDRETLDAMLDAARAFFPELRRYLKAKARALGLPRLAWYDLFAPVGESERAWHFEESREFITRQFGTYADGLADLAKRAFTQGWIDAEPRDGKRGGAFCIWLRNDESRVLANYKPAYGGLSTLAHELGHAYHNLQRADCTYIQRQTPMTLAETASTFCETIVREAALKQADVQEQLLILEASLQHDLQVTIDITSRLLFEQRVFEQRKARELAASEFCELMLEAQRETYGDGLDQEQLHPYMWAVKPHYYSSTFYNFPYMFGHLFSLGLYARYQADPEGFKATYDALLSQTGMADAATLAQRFDIDVRTPDFWKDSLEIIRQNVDRFVALVDETA